MKNKNSKYRADRSLLVNIFNSRKSSFNKRRYTPGAHPKKMMPNKKSAENLIHRQRFCKFYGTMTIKQMKTLIKDNMMYPNYKSKIIAELESGLCTIIFRSGFTVSLRQARQLINHRKVFVNGVINNSPNSRLKNGSIISFEEKTIERIRDNVNSTCMPVPRYIFVNKEAGQITFERNNIPASEADVIYNFPVDLDNIIKSFRLG